VTYRSRDTRLVESLIKYVKDIKPYHVKLKNFTSELFFKDKFNAAFFKEDMTKAIYLQNVWTKNDVGGWQLSNVSDGVERDRYIRLPATIFPRFAADVFEGQTPPGDDPGGGLSVEWSYAHQTGADEAPYELDVISTKVSVLAVNLVGGTYQVEYDIAVTAEGLVGYHGIDASVATLSHGGSTSPTILVQAAPNVWKANGVLGSVPVSRLATVFGDVNLKNLVTAFLEAQAVQLFVMEGTGRFKVPFHHGSHVLVNGERKEFGVDYVVSQQRDAIQFLAGKHPGAADKITINYFNCDRLFISKADPFDWNVSRAYDMMPFDEVPFDTEDLGSFDMYGYDDNEYDTDSVTDLASDKFILTIDKTYSGWHRQVEFYNVRPGTNKAVLDEIMVYPSEASGNVWEITAVSFLSVKVQQVYPIVGPVEYAYLGQRFDNGKIGFILKSPWIPYYLVQDDNSYMAFDVTGYDTDVYSMPMEETDLWVNLDVQTEHGVVNDPAPPIHAAVRLSKLGVVHQRLIDTLNGPQPIYEFVLDEVPVRGTYVEVRVEQARQYNPRVNASFREKFEITELLTFADSFCTNSVRYSGQVGLTVAMLDPGYDDRPYDANMYDSELPYISNLASMLYPAVPVVNWNGLTIPNLTSAANDAMNGGTIFTPSWYGFADADYYLIPYDANPYFAGVLDLRLFEPVCLGTINTEGYDTTAYDSDVLDGAEVYATIKDDFYLTLHTIDAGTNLVYHHVELHPNATFYQEPQEVNVLVLRHYMGSDITVEVFNNNLLVNGAQVIIEEQRVEIRLPTAMSVAVFLTSNQPA
jgi:hypothetical protein